MPERVKVMTTRPPGAFVGPDAARANLCLWLVGIRVQSFDFSRQVYRICHG